MRDLWEARAVKDDDRSIFQFMVELQDKLADSAEIAAENANISASRYKSYFDIISKSPVPTRR